jgi:hypothetical protein
VTVTQWYFCTPEAEYELPGAKQGQKSRLENQLGFGKLGAGGNMATKLKKKLKKKPTRVRAGKTLVVDTSKVRRSGKWLVFDNAVIK